MDGQPLVLVTDASRRLGKTFAPMLAKRGYPILSHYFNVKDEATATADEIRLLGVPVYLAQADLTGSAAFFSLLSILDNPLVTGHVLAVDGGYSLN